MCHFFKRKIRSLIKSKKQEQFSIVKNAPAFDVMLFDLLEIAVCFVDRLGKRKCTVVFA